MLLLVLLLTYSYAQNPFTPDNELQPFVGVARNALQATADTDCVSVPVEDTAECFIYIGTLTQVGYALEIARFSTELYTEAKFVEWQDNEAAYVQVYQDVLERNKLQIIVIPVNQYALYIVFRDVSE